MTPPDPGVALPLEELHDFRFGEVLRDRDGERHHQSRVAGGGGAPRDLVGDAVGRVAPHRPRAAAAVELRGPREQQLQVVVQLGHRPDRRARGTHRIGLVDGDGRRDALDGVHLRLVHAVEELPRVRAERLHVAPLPLGEQRVEHQRALARARHPGHHDQLVDRQREVEVLEVVLARAADDDGLGGGPGRMLGSVHGRTGKTTRGTGIGAAQGLF
jgi:hypothetical protein